MNSCQLKRLKEQHDARQTAAKLSYRHLFESWLRDDDWRPVVEGGSRVRVLNETAWSEAKKLAEHKLTIWREALLATGIELIDYALLLMGQVEEITARCKLMETYLDVGA